jgi:hypothetical protein
VDAGVQGRTRNANRGSLQRGIVASQWVSHLLGPDAVANHPKELLDAIETPANELRDALAGELRTAILGIIDAAIADGDDVYATLFELSDLELIGRLMTLGQRAHVILANGSHEKPKGQPMKDENAAARAQLAGIDLHDRMVKSGLAHKKFLVVVDVLLFSSEAARATAQAAIGADGQVRAQGCGVMVDWVATPHVVAVRNALLFVATDDPATLAAVEAAASHLGG